MKTLKELFMEEPKEIVRGNDAINGFFASDDDRQIPVTGKLEEGELLRELLGKDETGESAERVE